MFLTFYFKFTLKHSNASFTSKLQTIYFQEDSSLYFFLIQWPHGRGKYLNCGLLNVNSHSANFNSCCDFAYLTAQT